MAHEFAFRDEDVVYERNGVTVRSFPVTHAIDGAVGYRVDFAGLSMVFSGDNGHSWPLVRACEGGVDLLIHECFPTADDLAEMMGMPTELADIIINTAHTSPRAAGKVFDLAKPRMAGLWHTMLSPTVPAALFAEIRKVYDGPVVQTQDLTVFDITASRSSHAKPTSTRSRRRSPVSHASPSIRPRWPRPNGVPKSAYPSTTCSPSTEYRHSRRAVLSRELATIR